jgi:hypothetical protein
VLVAVGVVLPPPEVVLLAEQIIADKGLDKGKGRETILSGLHRARGGVGDEEGGEDAMDVAFDDTNSQSAGHSNSAADETLNDYKELVLSVFASAALQCCVNNRRHCRERESSYVSLAKSLTTCELEFCIEPTGSQGFVWTEGDVLHHWKYCVHPSLKAADKPPPEPTSGYRSSEDEGQEEYLNKFYSPILSSALTSRWSNIGLAINEKDFMELRVVRQRRFLDQEKLEGLESESDGDNDESNAHANSTGAGTGNSSAEEEGEDMDASERGRERDRDRDRPRGGKKGADRRSYSALGFTALGIAGCVAAQPLDPSIRPRSRAKKGKPVQEEEESTGFDPQGEKFETVELQDDWISVPGIGHHTIRGETFDSLQQEEWTNLQVLLSLSFFSLLILAHLHLVYSHVPFVVLF